MVDKLREKSLSRYPNPNIVDIIIQRRQTTQEIETESVTLIEISIHTAIPGKIVGRLKEPLNELKDLLEQVSRKTARFNNSYQKLNYLNVLESNRTLTPSASIIADLLIE
jgi:hypothetical protein